MTHTFHIPVLGLGFSIDTPLKVAKFGISSVVSIVDDDLIERMRKFHCQQNGKPYSEIRKYDEDHRARRITAYLNLLNELIDEQFADLKNQPFTATSDLTKYFELLPDYSPLRQQYLSMLSIADNGQKLILQDQLRVRITRGAIDVNIMSKVDKVNLRKDGTSLGNEFTDALASLRGFANSDLTSSVVLSAGMNPHLYSYLEKFADFLPDKESNFRKSVILKVSDYRSALIQAKFLAKKGVWVSEFRIESGLNCGGHAFATEGFLLGPVLEEFKQKRQELQEEIFKIYQTALKIKAIDISIPPPVRVTVQGGIGTAAENAFLSNYYQLDGTGWGSPFLLVPEATNVDDQTRRELENAPADDYFISGASPLGVPFNNFRRSGAEKLRLERINKGRPGSPCTKKFLVSNTEFTATPICTASREYQNLKIKELDTLELSKQEHEKRFNEITEKTCLCVGLCTSVYLKHNLLGPKESKAASICPGPNLAFFSRSYTLSEMVNHIYGRTDLIGTVSRSHMFINELNLYIDYLKKDIKDSLSNFTQKKEKQLLRFKDQLFEGIRYYYNLLPEIGSSDEFVTRLKSDLFNSELSLAAADIPSMESALVSDLNHYSS